MNILDENILFDQRLLLRRSRIVVRQIGHDIGSKGMTDEEMIPLLLRLRRPTFFTLDIDYYERRLCHDRYCIVWLDVAETEAAKYVRRLLRHRTCDTQAKRMGSVIRVSPQGLAIWRLHADRPILSLWNE